MLDIEHPASSIEPTMSAERFIASLEERGLLSNRLMDKLRDKLARSDRPLSAKALAKFLVEKQHLTQSQATEVLSTLLRTGADLDAAPTEDPPVEELAEEALALISPPSSVEIAENLLPQMPADEAEPEIEGSSIFEAFPSPVIYEERNPNADEELGLAPDSDLDVANEDRPDRSKQIVEEEPSELPELGDYFKQPEPRKSSKPAREPQNDSDPVADALVVPEADAATTLKTKKSKRRKSKKPVKRANEWDSPLLLLGGGALVVLVLGGLTISWLLNTESADEKLTRAQKAVDAGSYTQAITEYEQFLEKFPRHRDRSMARVKLAMAQLRKATESGNYQIALDVANSELQAIEDEEKFSELANAELAALLPRIALGLAKESEAAREPEAAKLLIDKSTAALGLAINTKYVPKSFRDEAELDEVRETLSRVERRQKSQQDLQQAIAAMEQSITEGDTRTAYTHHVQFIKQHPDLAGEAALAEMLRKTTAAEQAAIRFIADEKPAETADRPTPWIAALAIANRRIQPPAAANATPAPVCIRVDGAVYGLDAASGRLLWRRFVGHAAAAAPINIDGQVFIADSNQHELLSLDALTGKLRWRQTLGEKFASPLIVGERIFLPADSGHLYVLDRSTGARQGYVEFAQPLRVVPAVDREAQRLYVTGDHSSLYVLSLDDFSCLGVYYLGHAEGGIGVAPVVVMNKLALLENDGVETSRLRLMALDEKGSIVGQVVEKRLTGLAQAPPIAAGRRLIVPTDRGQIDVYEVGTGQSDDALTLVATRAAGGTKPILRHAALAGNSLWVGDTRLTKYSILPTGNRLPVESIENNFEGDTFDHPLALLDNRLIHVHRPKGRAGVVVTATDTSKGRTIWETDLAQPLAGRPIVDAGSKTLVVASAEGRLFRFDENALRSRIQDTPLPQQSAPAQLPPLSFAIDLGLGRAAFGAPDSDRLLLYLPTSGAARWITLASPLASAATAWKDGLIAPTRVGQVFYLGSNGESQATPFQPLLQPGTEWNYQPAAVVGEQQFILTDGREKMYLVALVNQPQPHLKSVAEAKLPHPVDTPSVVLNNFAMAVASSSHIVRFELPALELAGEANLPAPVEWGPFQVGNAMLLSTANNELLAISASGEIAWQVPIEHGDIAGEPLVSEGSVLLTYRNGLVERRSLADGKPLATADLEHPLAAGPVRFLQRLVLTTADGSLLVVDEP